MKCAAECKNNGVCNTEIGKCICQRNCEGEFCEVCHAEIPYALICGALAGLVITVLVVRWIVVTIRHRCM